MAMIETGQSVMAQWYTLVMDAAEQSNSQLAQEAESYLVFLLNRFTQRTDIGQLALAEQFLTALQQVPESYQLRDVGDQCLLVAGLFPERAIRRRLKPDYYIQMGQGAYQAIAQVPVAQASLYDCLARAFSDMVKVLRLIRNAQRS